MTRDEARALPLDAIVFDRVTERYLKVVANVSGVTVLSGREIMSEPERYDLVVGQTAVQLIEGLLTIIADLGPGWGDHGMPNEVKLAGYYLRYHTGYLDFPRPVPFSPGGSNGP